jgi:hypothetical protein
MLILTEIRIFPDFVYLLFPDLKGDKKTYLVPKTYAILRTNFCQIDMLNKKEKLYLTIK